MELPKGPSHPCCTSRSSTTYPSPLERKHESPPTSRGAPFALPSSRGGILSLRSRERIPGVPVASQVEALSTGNARGTPESCHHSKSPLDLSPFQRNLFSLHYLDFHAGAARLPSSLQPLVLPWEALAGLAPFRLFWFCDSKHPGDFTSSPMPGTRARSPVRKDRRSRGAAHWPPRACAWSPHSTTRSPRAVPGDSRV